jgi:hypothetical protein
VTGVNTIFCSRCGAPEQTVESYCRSCGEWLPDPSAAMTPRGRLRHLSPERKQRRMRLLELLSATAALVSALTTLAVLTGADVGLLVIPLVLCFAVVGWQLVTFFMGRSIQKRQHQAAAEGGQALPTTQAGVRPVLNAADTRDLVPPPSVTEHTTELLDPIPAKKGGGE